MWAQEAMETDRKPAQHWTPILDDYFSSTALCWYIGMSQTLKNQPLSNSLYFSLWAFIRTDERHAPFQPKSQRSPQPHSVSLLFLCFRRDHEFLICPKGPFWSFWVSGLWRFTNEGFFSPLCPFTPLRVVSRILIPLQLNKDSLTPEKKKMLWQWASRKMSVI